MRPTMLAGRRAILSSRDEMEAVRPGAAVSRARFASVQSKGRAYPSAAEPATSRVSSVPGAASGAPLLPFPREIRFAPDNYTAGQLRQWLRIKHGFCILVGDVHQPLHATSRFNSAEPKGEEGGNDVNISAACPATTRQNCTRSKNGSVRT